MLPVISACHYTGIAIFFGHVLWRVLIRGPYFNDEAKTAEEINKKKVNTKKHSNWELNVSNVLTSEKDFGLQRCDAVDVSANRSLFILKYKTLKESNCCLLIPLRK
jgi:hypothetical protein